METKRSAAAAAAAAAAARRSRCAPVTNENGSGETASLFETWKCPGGGGGRRDIICGGGGGGGENKINAMQSRKYA